MALAESKLSTKDQFRSIWHLGGLSAGQLVKRAWADIDEDNDLGRSSELAYNYLLAIFPLLLFLLTVFGLFASRGTQLRSNLFFYLAQVLPPAAFELVTKANLRDCAGTLGGFGWDDLYDIRPERGVSRSRIALLA